MTLLHLAKINFFINFQVFFDALCGRQINFNAPMFMFSGFSREIRCESIWGSHPGHYIVAFLCIVRIFRRTFYETEAYQIAWNVEGRFTIFARCIENENHCVRRRETLAHTYVDVQTGRALNHQVNALRIR